MSSTNGPLTKAISLFSFSKANLWINRCLFVVVILTLEVDKFLHPQFLQEQLVFENERPSERIFQSSVARAINSLHCLWKKWCIDNWNFLSSSSITIRRTILYLYILSDIVNSFSKRWEIAIGNIWDRHTDSGWSFYLQDHAPQHLDGNPNDQSIPQALFYEYFLYILLLLTTHTNRRHWNSCFTGDIINRYCIVCIHSISFLYHIPHETPKKQMVRKFRFSWFHLFHFITICKHFQVFLKIAWKNFIESHVYEENHLSLIFNSICCMRLGQR